MGRIIGAQENTQNSFAKCGDLCLDRSASVNSLPSTIGLVMLDQLPSNAGSMLDQRPLKKYFFRIPWLDQSPSNARSMLV